MLRTWAKRLGLGVLATLVVGLPLSLQAAEEEAPVKRKYVHAPAAPRTQTQADADAKSSGCLTCHVKTDQPTMHATPAVVLGCTDCHGGDAKVMAPANLPRFSAEEIRLREQAHVLPKYPKTWHYDPKHPSSANPK